MPTHRQFKAARALLEWTQAQLAEKIGVSVLTIKRLERGEQKVSDETARRAREALEAGGIAFSATSEGVRLRRG